MKRAIILLSSNHEAFKNIEIAKKYLSDRFDKIVFSESIESNAIGGECGIYLNAVAIVETEKRLEDMESFLKATETILGRVRGLESKGLVQIDLDLVEWNGNVLRPKDAARPYYVDCLNSLK